eukprot:gene9642-10661_t
MVFISTIILGFSTAAAVPLVHVFFTSYWDIHHSGSDLPTQEEFPVTNYSDHLRLGKMIQVIYDSFNDYGKSDHFGGTILVTEKNLSRLVEETFPGYHFEGELHTIIRLENEIDPTSFMGFILTKLLPNGKKEVVIVYRGTVTPREWIADATTLATHWNENPQIAAGCDANIASQFTLNDYLQLLLPLSVYRKLPYITKDDPITLHQGFKGMYVTNRDVNELYDAEVDRLVEKLEKVKGISMSPSAFRDLPAEQRIQYIQELERRILEGPQARCRYMIDALHEKGEIERVVVAGHSLGAALAIITALDLAQYLSSKKNANDIQVEAVTFACPKVGNYRFLEVVEEAQVSHYHHHVRGDFVPFSGFFTAFRKEVGRRYRPFRYGETLPFLKSKYRSPKSFLFSLAASTTTKSDYLGVFHSLDVILHNLSHFNGVVEIPRSIAFVNRKGDYLDHHYSNETQSIPPNWFTGLANRGMHMRKNGEIAEIGFKDLKADKTGRLQARINAFIDLYIELHRDEGKQVLV